MTVGDADVPALTVMERFIKYLDCGETLAGAAGRAEVAGVVGVVLTARTSTNAFMDSLSVKELYRALAETAGFSVPELDQHVKAAAEYKTGLSAVVKSLQHRDSSTVDGYVKVLTDAAEDASLIEPVDLPCIGAAQLIAAAQSQGTLRRSVEGEQRKSSEGEEALLKTFGGTQSLGTVELSPGKDTAVRAEETVAEETVAEDPKVKLARLYTQLDGLVGLTEVKKEIRQQVELLRVEQLREKFGMKSPDVTRHLVFTGNPGTGKTTIARLVGEIYATIKILETGQLVEVDKSGLVGGFLGQSEQKTAEAVKQAIGGVLFIDEAYALVGDEYGEAAIDILVKAAEDYRDDLVIVLAGYTDPMGELLNTNPGLRSRFRTVVFFPDYTADELVEIFVKMVNTSDYECAPGTVEAFEELVSQVVRDDSFGNARWVRNCFETAMTRHAWRLKDVDAPTEEQLRTLTAEDLAEENE